jgi:hypothetical protein
VSVIVVATINVIKCNQHKMKNYTDYSHMTIRFSFVFFFLYAGCFHQKVSVTPFEQNGLWGYRNVDDEVIIEPSFYMALEFNSYGLAAVVDDSGWLYINLFSEKIIRPYVIDNGPDFFREGLARYVKNSRIGFFDQKGNVVVQAEFEFVRPFSDEMAAFCRGGHIVQDGEYKRIAGGKWGYIDMQGVVIIPALYDRAEDFNDGKAAVVRDGNNFLINKRGEMIK